jgi:superfamily II DNA or RNA helicase/predicted RNA methylase
MPTVKELKIIAKARGLKRYSKLRKAQLIAVIKDIDDKIELLEANKKLKKKPLVKKKLKKKSKKILKLEAEKKRIDGLIRKTGDRIAVSSKPLQQHQKDFVNNFINGDKEIKGAIAIHGVGTGKTLTAVIAGEMFLDKNPKEKVFIITPASLLEGFKKELYAYDPAIEKDKRYNYYTYDGYSNAVKRGDAAADCTGGMLIVDEAQNLRTKIKKVDRPVNTDGIMSIAEDVSSGKKVLNILRGCAIKARRILLLSATPIVNDIIDIENLMAIINQHEPLDAGQLSAVFSDPELIKKYFGCRLSFFKNSPRDSAKYFPKMEEKFVPLVMTGKILAEYKSVASDGSPQTKAFFNGLRRIANTAGGDNSPKTNFIISWISSVLAKKTNFKIGLTKNILDTHTDKTVIFTHFKGAGTDGIIRRLKKAKIPFGLINGSVSKSNRSKIVDSYVAGDIKVILISKAGAEGLNLLETGYMFLVEPSWNNTEREQVKGRGVRFRSHINLPVAKRNVLVLSLFLILPKEKNNFKKLLTSKPLKKIGNNESIDLMLFKRSNMKQEAIDTALNRLKKVDSLEECKYPKEFLDISNIFNMTLVNKEHRTTDLKETYEEAFYDTDWNVKLSPTQLSTEPAELTIQQLKKEMTKTTRAVFGSDKQLIKQQQAFFTPPTIASDMIRFLQLKNAKYPLKILEPSAGIGMLIFDALLESKKAYFDAVENLDPLKNFLMKFPRTDVSPKNNFMTVPIPPDNDKYRVVIMNPPFNLSKGKGFSDRATHDVDFVMRAFDMLAPNAILICLISSKYTYRGLDKKNRADYKVFQPFRDLLKNNLHSKLEYKTGFSGLDAPLIKAMKTPVEMRMIKIYKMPDYYKSQVKQNIIANRGGVWDGMARKNIVDNPSGAVDVIDLDFTKYEGKNRKKYISELREKYPEYN